MKKQARREKTKRAKDRLDRTGPPIDRAVLEVFREATRRTRVHEPKMPIPLGGE